VGECPLKISFHRLFQISLHPETEVAQAYNSGRWSIQFGRQLNAELSAEWTQLQELLNHISLEEGRDLVYLGLEQSKRYSTKSLYRLITSGAVRYTQMSTIWQCLPSVSAIEVVLGAGVICTNDVVLGVLTWFWTQIPPRCRFGSVASLHAPLHDVAVPSAPLRNLTRTGSGSRRTPWRCRRTPSRR
jgi:hypothetical protein